jgi:plastocyanin
MSFGHSTLRRGLLAATATLAAGAAVVAGVSVAGAAQSVTVFATENSAAPSKPCFSTEGGKSVCTTNEHPTVTIQTGDTVTWDFDGSTPGTLGHNVKASNAVAADPAWQNYKGSFQSTGTYSRQFGAAGVYEFLCEAHAGMNGTIKVEGEPVETATPTATPTPTPTATPTPTPTPVVAAATPDDHTSTPAPGHASSAKDTEVPRLARVSAKALREGVRVRFWLSEPATVTIAARRRGSKTVLTSATVQAPAGTRALILGSKPLKKGTYTVELRPTDAMGNRATAATTATLRVK